MVLRGDLQRSRGTLSQWQAVDRLAKRMGWSFVIEGDYGIGHSSMVYSHPRFGVMDISYNRERATQVLAYPPDWTSPVEITGSAIFYRLALALHGLI